MASEDMASNDSAVIDDDLVQALGFEPTPLDDDDVVVLDDTAVDEAAVDEAAVDEAAVDEAAVDEAAVDEAAEEEPALGDTTWSENGSEPTDVQYRVVLTDPIPDESSVEAVDVDDVVDEGDGEEDAAQDDEAGAVVDELSVDELSVDHADLEADEASLDLDAEDEAAIDLTGIESDDAELLDDLDDLDETDSDEAAVDETDSFDDEADADQFGPDGSSLDDAAPEVVGLLDLEAPDSGEALDLDPDALDLDPDALDLEALEAGDDEFEVVARTDGDFDGIDMPPPPGDTPPLEASPPVIAPAAAAAVAAQAPETSTRPKRQRRRKQLRARKARRVVRHVDPWSVLTFSVLFHLCFFAAMLLASVLVWNAAIASGTLENIENFIRELGDYETFEINGDAVFRAAVIIAGMLTLASSVLVVLLTVVFNLISDLVGGIRITVIEEETVRVPAKQK